MVVRQSVALALTTKASFPPPQERAPGFEGSVPRRGGVQEYLECGRWDGQGRTRLHAPLPPADIMPGSEFVSDVPIDPHGLKAEGFVQPHAGGIGQGDASVALVKALQSQQLKESGIQGPADAGAPRLLMDIH